MVGKARPVTEHWEHTQQEAQDVRNFRDPHSINIRLENQTSRLLKLIEETPDDEIDIKILYMSLIAIWRMRVVGVALRKEKIDDPIQGSAVKRYATAFQDDVGRRKTGTGPATPGPEEADDDELDAIIDGTDGDDSA